MIQTILVYLSTMTLMFFLCRKSYLVEKKSHRMSFLFLFLAIIIFSLVFGMRYYVGIDYHIEVTRLDFGVPVFVLIKRDSIYLKKFVFRFKKDISTGLGDLTNAGMLKVALSKRDEEDKA